MPKNTGSIHDVNRPGRVQPTPTSRPIIVGHRPTMPDPMVTRRPPAHTEVSQPNPPQPASPPPPLTPIDGISMPSQTHSDNPQLDTIKARPLQPHPVSLQNHGPQIAERAHHSKHPSFDMLRSGPPIRDVAAPNAIREDARPSPQQQAGNLNNYRIQWWAPVGLLLIILCALYLAIDSGLINTDINLPFHVFKQSSSTSSQ